MKNDQVQLTMSESQMQILVITIERPAVECKSRLKLWSKLYYDDDVVRKRMLQLCLA